MAVLACNVNFELYTSLAPRDQERQGWLVKSFIGFSGVTVGTHNAQDLHLRDSLDLCCRPPSPSQTKDGRNGLFGVLQGTERGNPAVDSWMGHPLVDPKKGKLGLSAPTDATGESIPQSGIWRS